MMERKESQIALNYNQLMNILWPSVAFSGQHDYLKLKSARVRFSFLFGIFVAVNSQKKSSSVLKVSCCFG